MLLDGRANQWFHQGLEELMAEPLCSSRNGPMRERLHVLTRLPDPRQRVLTIPRRRSNPFFQTAQAVWVLAGSANADWICRYNSQLRAYLDPGATAFHGAYGHRLRGGTRDQLRDVITQLERDPDSRRAVAIIRDPRRDHPDLAPRDPPCNLALTFSA